MDSELHSGYTILKATNTPILEKALQGFKDNGKPIIIAIIENLIEDAVRKATSQSEARELGKKAIDKFTLMIKTYEKNYQDSVVAIVKPIGRNSVDWFDCNVEGWTEDLVNAVAGSKMRYLAVMETIKDTEQLFEKDATHLNKKSGEYYINYMMELGKQMPLQESTKQDKPENMEVELSTSKRKHCESTDETLEERLNRMEQLLEEHDSNHTSSNIAIRKIREELDADTNDKKMDMLVISGVRPTIRYPNKENLREKNEWLRRQALLALKKFDKKIGENEVRWANNLGHPGMVPIVLEVKMDSETQPTKSRYYSEK
jgi:hypothetical protein